MNLLMITLRIIHIFSGIIWVGVGFFNVRFLQPTVQETGSEGQAVMRHLTSQTHFTLVMYSVATLSLASGLLMYWQLFGFSLSALSNPYPLTLAIGGVAGLIAWVIAIFFVRQTLSQIQAIGKAIQAQGSPPTPEQAAGMQEASARMVRLGQAGLGFLIVAVLGMSIAQYL